MRFILFFTISLFSLSLNASNASKYLEVYAQEGDGIFALLRRYQLIDYSCNLDKFYSINRIKGKHRLSLERKYKLPIRIYKYNGKNIRTTTGIKDWDTAVKIRDYNRHLTKVKLKKSAYEKDKVLFVPYHIKNCPTPNGKLDATENKQVDGEPIENLKGDHLASRKSKNRNYPIFGAKHEKIPLSTTKLRGQIYYVVAGHGGPDPGAIGKRGQIQLCEDEYAYDIALRLSKQLIANGAIVYVITRDPNDGIREDAFLKCDQDELNWRAEKILRKQKPRLFQRSNAINKLYWKHRKAGQKKQKLICLHIDSQSRKKRTDVFFYYKKGSKKGRKTAYNIQKTLKKKYEKYQKGRGYSGKVQYRDLHMLRETKPSAVYVELGNIQNPVDQQRFLRTKNRQLLSEWLYEGLVK